MRIYGVFLAVFIIFSYVLTGCDSSTDSKAVGVSYPVLVYPANLDSNISLTPFFKWTVTTADKIQIDINSSFSSPIYSAAVTDTTHQLPDSVLQIGGGYYWRVIKNISGTEYPSGINFFRTIH